VGMTAGSVLRRGIKAAVLPFGVPGRRLPGDVIMLVYHRVGAGAREIDLTRGSFARQLASLASSGGVRSLDDALGDERGGVVLTFDDGYRDFHDHVLPLLEEHRMPAVLYLATSLVAGDRAAADPSPDSLTWDMLRDAASTGLVTVGSHTHRHADLSGASEEQAEDEMRRSKDLIEHHLRVPCRHFAYPWGVGSPGAQRAAGRLFVTAALDSWRTNRRGRTDPHHLGRTPVLRSDGSGVFFRAKTRGLLDGEAIAYRVLRRGPWSRMGPEPRR
jgi:peptidoglycan/xylan/chitin deacetylase (PgdA/CDA1 family)